MGRDGQFVGMIGLPGCGKSHLIKEIIKLAAKKNKQRVTIVVEEDGEALWAEYPVFNLKKQSHKDAFKKYNGISVVVLGNDSEKIFSFLWNEMEKGCLKNSQLVLDDGGLYMEKEPPESLLKLAGRKRNNQIDIWATFHGFSEINAAFFKKMSGYGLFATIGEDSTKTSLPRKAMILPHKKRIDDLVISGGRDFNGRFIKRRYVEFFDTFGHKLKLSI